MDAYDNLGVGTALYMRLVHGSRAVYVLLFLIGLVPLIYNSTGSLAQTDATKLYVLTTLGNANNLNYLHSLPDLFIVLITTAAIVWGTLKFHHVNDRVNPLRSIKNLNAARYTCMIEGLPRDPSLSFDSLVSQLRQLCSRYGNVLCVSVARANRDVLLLIRKRQGIKTELSYYRVAGYRKEACTKRDATKRKLEAKLAALDDQIQAISRASARPVSAGVCFVTFNQQSEAVACFEELLQTPKRTLALAGKDGSTRETEVHLAVSVPPPPSQIIWENLEFTPRQRYLRRLLANAILLAQTALSTYAIVAVNGISLNETLNVNAGQLDIYDDIPAELRPSSPPPSTRRPAASATSTRPAVP